MRSTQRPFFATNSVIRWAVLSLLFLCLGTSVAFGQAQVTGQWQTLPNLMPVNPIHVALLHNGKVIAIGGSENYAPNLAAGQLRAALWDPQTQVATVQNVPWDMFCNGMVNLPDGRLLIAGGNLQYDPFLGLNRASIYDPVTNQYVDVQDMAHGRWYPTPTVLGDGSVLTFSGLNGTDGATNSTVEFYSVGSGWSQEYPAGWVPPLYPRLHLLPNGKVFYSGSGPNSALFDPATKTWSLNYALTNFGSTRTYGSSVLLPLTPQNGYAPKVMILGGGNPATATTEIIDLSVPNPVWKLSAPMSAPRIEMNAVLLPTGKVLALGGSANDEDAPTAALNADLFDPIAGTFSPAGTAAYPRLYHSTGLLLPDATVLVTGGNPTQGSYEQHMEIYSPAYLFTTNGQGATVPAARPTITSAPSAIGYGQAFTVQTPNAAQISSIALMRLGTPTHAFDFEQRMVGLSFTAGSGSLSVTGPPTNNIAPPGYYMLFLVNSSGVPSVAAMVQVSANPTDQPPKGTIVQPASDVFLSVGQTVNFVGSGTDPDGTISAYSWILPGGTPNQSTAQSPGTVTFSTPGTYIASLTVTDNAGVNDPSPPTRTIVVQPVPVLTGLNPASGATGQSLNVILTGSNFTPGDTCNFGAGITVNSCVFNASTQLVASVSIATSAALGGRTVSVSNAGGQSSSLANAFVVTQTGTTPPPVLTAVAPNSGNQGQTLNVTLSGINFQNGATCNFGPGVTVNSCVFGSSTLLTASISIAANANPGSIPVTVTNPDAQSSVLSGAFSIIGAGGLVHIDFNYPDRPSLLAGGWSYIATSPGGAPRDTEQTGTLAVSYDQTAHPGVIRIPLGSGENWQSLNDSQNTLFRALPANWTSVRLRVAAFNPLASYQQLGLEVYQDDDNYLDLNRVFAGAQSVELFHEVAQSTNSINRVALANTANLILRIDRSSNTYTAMYSIDSGVSYVVIGTDTLAFANPKLAIHTGSNPVAPIPADLSWIEVVMSSPLPAPSLTNVSPNSAILGQTLNVVMTGSNFQNGARCNFGDDITVNSCTFNSSTQLTANITVPANVGTGLRAVSVINPDNQSATINSGFTLNAPPPPAISSVLPNSANQGAAGNITINGGNFQTGMTCAFGAGITVNSCVPSTANQAIANISIALGATAGFRSITVTNPDAQSATLVNGFTVTVAPPPPAPTVTAASPNSGVPGAVLSVVISGTNFLSGATCNFGANITVNSCTVNSATQITAGISISATATLGFSNIVVTNPDTQSASLTNGFFINAPLHINFTYPDRTSFLADGWSYTATTAGTPRNTEGTGTLAPSYDQVAHPGTLRLPLASGEIWQTLNNSTNMVVRSLPGNWTSIRLKLAAFNPTVSYQQVGLLVYQDDDNYIDLNRVFAGAQSIEVFQELAQSTTEINRMSLVNTTNLILRIDRSGSTYTGSYSTDGGVTFTTVGTTTVNLTNPKMAIEVGSNPSTVINADLAWVEISQAAPLSPPAVTGISPVSANQGATASVTITGTAFQTGATCGFGAGVTVNSCAFVSATQMTANVTVAAAATPGTRTVTVTNPDSQTGSLVNGFTVTTPNPPPAVTSLNPVSANQGATTSVTITGTAFQSGATCSFGAGITVNSCAFVSATQLTAGITVASGAATGTRTVTVTNPDTQAGSLTNGFTVTTPPPPPPGITSLNPTSAIQGATTSVTITGTAFQSGATCSFGAGITVNSCAFVSATQLTAGITVSATATTGTRTVTVTNPDTQVGSLTNGFTVNAPPPPPTVTSLNPVSANQGATTSVTITGTAFQSGATCNFGAGITVNSCAFVSATQLTAGITVAAAATTGPRTVTVTNPDTQVGSLTNGFTVTLPPPTVTSLNPNSAIQGATTSVTITGTAFQSGATCSFGAGITVNSCAFVSATQLTAGITIASAATTGTRTVAVTNPDTQVGSLTNGFTVNAPPPPPTVTSLNPAAAIQGATTSVTITGTAFQSGATCSFGAGITVNSCAFVSATQLTAGITVSATAATGTRTVTVTNPDAQVGSLVNGFTVNVPPPPPTLTSLNPVSGIQGATVSVTITGTAFQSGATCNFGAGITVNSCAFVSATQLTAGITIASAAATGPRTVTVTNPDTQAGSLTNGFTVNAPAPAVTSLNPASANQGATTSVTITGTAFQSGATCSFGAGITVNSCAFVSATQLTAGITVASGAATGTRTVTVTNPDAQVGSLTNGFTVTAPPPTVTSVNPVSAIQGSTTSVTITGTAFQSGATCSFGAAITVNSCAFVSSTQLTAGITVASGATTGARTVTVTNPDTQVGSLTNGFTVTAPAPTVTGLNPVSANQGLTTSVTITGTAFQSGATCSFGAGITVNSCAFVSSTQMTAGITVAASATAGTRTVTVTNPDTQVGSLTNGFTVTVPSNPPPTLTSLAPNSGTIGGSAAITLTGTNFLNGATCNFGAGVTVNSCTFVSATQLTANITIPLGAVPGLRSVTVVNPDGQSSTLANSFTLNGPLHFDFTYPDRTSLLNAGWSYIATTAAGGTRDTEQSGALAPSYDQVAHPGTIRIPLGSGELWQSLNDSQNTLFRTLPSNWSSIRLKIASYNPVANYQQVGLLVYQNDDNYVDLNRLFANSQSIELFQESAQNTLSANRLSLANTGNLILRIDRSGSTYTGSYSVDGGANFVTVANTTIALTNPELGIQIGSNAGGPISADLSWVEIVQPAVLPAPGITSVAPSSAAQGVTTNLTITGTNFQSGATCSFGAGVTVNSCAFVSATQLTANVSISAVAAVGPRAVTVTNPDLQSGTTNGAFTVTASAPPPPPSLTSLNPTSGAQATTVNVTLTGTNFLSGATCSFGAGITVNSCTFNSATQLIANVTIAVSATTGTRSVTVTNPDNQTSTLANAFTVTSAPVLNAGNATAVVLINSANTTGFNTNTTNPGEFQRFTQQYLDHLQVPYVTVDVSLVTPPSNLSSRALIIAGHAGLNLSVDWQNAISSAVSAGAGFVNLDYNLNIGTAAHMKAIFGATGAVQGSQASTVSVPAALIPGGATPHFITALQKRFLGDPAGDVVYNFHQNTANVVPTVSATVLQGATGTVIAKLGTDPLILATTFGSGRAVNFGTYLHLQAGGFGFLQGTDDLFWRSLVWAARKPFVLRGYPRYFSVQMDDQLSGWGSRIQDAYNTSFTGTTAADGTGGPWKPTGFVYTANLPPGSAERAGVITDINAGKLAVSPHSVAGAAYGEMYWNGSAGALTDAQWLTNFNNILSWKTGNGGADAIPSFSRVLIGHYWDISNNVADDMWNQGFRYITTVQKPGFQQPNTNINQYNGAERFHDRPFWQFDQPPKLHVDEDQPFFFADDLTVGSRAGLPSHTFYHFTTQYHDWVKYPQRPDFIWPSSTNTMTPAQSVDQLERYTWRFWSSMAPVQLFTHDGGNYALATAADRQTVISQGSTWLNSNGVRHLFMDQLGDYIYARNKSTLTDASVSGTTISLTFTGKAATIDGALIPTQLYIFKQDVEGVPATVPGFTTGLSTTVPVP